MLGIVQVTSGPDKGTELPLPKGRPQVIGRGPAPAVALVLHDPQVAAEHCEVLMQDETPWLTDWGSASGTWVNGTRITRHALRPGDLIRIGDTELSFRWSSSDERATETFPAFK
jgi:pSer/pThr/pTyr-binding forkhead associated (FHA) protein